MKYIKSFADTSTMNAFIDNISEEGCYLLRDESKEGKDRIKSYRYFDYLCMTSTGNSTVSFSTQQTDIQYNINGGEWTDYVSETTINLSDGDKLCWLRDGNSVIANAVGKFSMTGSIAASGNCYSLISNKYKTLTDLTGWNNIFKELFYNCSALTSAPKLPATTLANNCYYFMFENCTSLTTAPVLPATTLASDCYYKMFLGCSSLTSAPELPATTLAYDCYMGMFRGCSALTTAPELPVTTLADYCYNGMFAGCTSLTSAPELPATTLVSGCYAYMFENCSNLAYIKCYATNISASNCLYNWVNFVSITGDFYKDANTNYPVGAGGIPAFWTKHNI